MEIRNQRSEIRNLLWLVIPTLLFILALWLDLFPFLRGPEEWRWPLRPIEAPLCVIVPFITLTLYTVVCARWLRIFDQDRPSHKSEYGFLLFITLAAPLIQFALAFAVSRYPLLEFFGPTVSVHNSGYFTTAVTTSDLNQLLANYPAMMPQLPIHAQSHPPGPIVMQWLGWKFFQGLPALADSIAMPLRTLQCHNPGLMSLDNPQIASASIGMLLPLIGALAVWPMYALGKRVATSRAASIAVALFPVMPLFAMWPTQWDQLYPLLLLVGLYFVYTGLESRSLWRIFCAGVPLSIATFFSVGNFVLMAVVGLYGLIWLITHRRWKLAFPAALAFALGCAAIWITYALIYQVNPLEVISTGSRLAFESTTGQRSYLTWLIWNPIDFAIFLSVPIVILLVVNLAKGSEPSPGSLPLIIATFGTLVLLIISGVVRGEVGRLWMYFGPLVLLIVADLAMHQAPRTTPRVSLITRHSLLIALLALIVLTLNTRWLVNDYFLDEPPDRTPNFIAAQPTNATSYSFDHQIALRGYDAAVAADAIDLTLHWQALTQLPHAYTVFAHVTDASGQPVGQKDNMPVRDQLPTSCWQPGEYVTDPYSIALKSGARAPFTIEVGLYRLENGVRLPLDDGAGTSVRLNVP